MAEKSIFISSCSRRQLARRRPAGIASRGRRAGGIAGAHIPRALAADVLGIPLLLLALIALAALAAGLLVAGP